MFATDRDLLAIEPNVFRDAGVAGQRLLKGACDIGGTTLTLTAQDVDFAAADIGPGHVALVDGTPYEVIARLTSTTATISRIRAGAADPVQPPSPATGKPVEIWTFAPQIAAAHRLLLRMLGIDPEDPPAPFQVTEQNITNPASLAPIEALGGSLRGIRLHDALRARRFRRLGSPSLVAGSNVPRTLRSPAPTRRRPHRHQRRRTPRRHPPPQHHHPHPFLNSPAPSLRFSVTPSLETPMLLLNPRTVRFGPATWDNIAAAVIDRNPHKAIEEWSEAGPFATVADVPEQRIRITITQELTRDDISAPRPGDAATLTLYTAPALADSGRKKVSCAAVVLAVTHQLSLQKGSLRTIQLAAVSPDGAADPITISDASDGSL